MSVFFIDHDKGFIFLGHGINILDAFSLYPIMDKSFSMHVC